MEGNGTMTWKDGKTYTGMWIKSVKNVKGRMAWPNGTIYEGQFKDGVGNGYAIMK